MRHIFTLFDYKSYPPTPLQSLVVDGMNISYYNFYLPHTGLKLCQINENKAKFRKLFDQPCCINDFKSHVVGFNLDSYINYEVYDLAVQLTIDKFENSKYVLARVAKELVKKPPQDWMKLRANASVVYQDIEKRGVINCYKKIFPHYHLNVKTGRSSTDHFNIQGSTIKDNILHINEAYDCFVHLDWVAADLRMAAFMSQDPDMEQSFMSADPYDAIVKFLDDPLFPRDKVKLRFLKAWYSLSLDDPIFDMFPVFRKYMYNKQVELNAQGYLCSCMGRKFIMHDDKEKLSVFNSPYQGSVVHAMQASIIEIFKRYPNHLLTEIHDSIILCCDEKMLKAIINDGVKIMLNPLKNFLPNPPIMPVKVSVGKKWQQWELLRVYRNEQETT